MIEKAGVNLLLSIEKPSRNKKSIKRGFTLK